MQKLNALYSNLIRDINKMDKNLMCGTSQA